MNCNIRAAEFMCQAQKREWDEIVLSLTQKSEVLMTFLDTGCDGNSIKIHFKTFNDALIRKLCDLAAVDDEIFKRNV